MKLDDIRREYVQGGLRRETLQDNPIEQFEIWLKQAVEAKFSADPTAMVVATVDKDGQPSQRIVLLKNLDQNGFVFFTNTGSKKAQDLSANNKISLHFPWHAIERQVIVYGEAKPLSTAAVAKYFLSRPKESQLAAWASQQSRPVSSRQALMQTFEGMKSKFAKGDIPLPDFWGGYCVVPHKIEFWQGGEHRLHDRFMYVKQADDNWSIERLNP
ncbi:pyridoxamine 5'-phosphate oxidase [Pseudoalteromonas luteoviolacea]|uniref:Pyridoxine/pyridoxamine 5'-phosphate oxidase n=1 Tax=Pseudoalteromonas luteoviolacea S4054 TaxID=1129367 RepID=A0A0F6A7P3_9GAMM|nr:pyridoxamine 5'-phosphate oxidase [Pseudoalteromonas luteoviolacea]AOT06793.1 pyridoxamine 5'-phosphate oxidase [Pseudoalteromonas luteoviolacea]AOT11711.1 pyridoxamine 5'-phosphate oxidase [Pseudoalteromonas luteoviolacea]AOT16623.1 pyridoxamine 5'-phosphate oxidase [Pseudoalteromonas luteoviolacea]KKE82148.1 pyridoxine 5'-phosphate oxidase [Pseudoalteromonas luteoviolacea S4054]KZN74102.1 pyridoxine 5'-phosphate oxidase [Pseudoalteromonas luteoviolacea S4047-1]